jgi:hypothetical protein
VKKKIYIKPEIRKIILDNSITLLMQTNQPSNPETGGNIGADGKKSSDPFASPYGDKPFN